MKIILNQQMCTGHGRCYALAPDIFAPDDHGHAELIDPTEREIPASLVDQARVAVANCPEQAITAID